MLVCETNVVVVFFTYMENETEFLLLRCYIYSEAFTCQVTLLVLTTDADSKGIIFFDRAAALVGRSSN